MTHINSTSEQANYLEDLSPRSKVIHVDHDNDHIIYRGEALSPPFETYYRFYWYEPPTAEWQSVIVSESWVASHIAQHHGAE